MTEHTLPLITFYRGWETYQQSLVETIAPLSPEQLTLPAASHEWTIGKLAQHIVGNRVWWFQVWMGEGSPDLAPIAHWDPQDVEAVSLRSPAELVAGLESTWQMIRDALSRWTADDLGHIFQPPAALREDERENFPPFSRQWIVWHVLEHEIHHGGELSLALGAYGLPGIYGSM
ncbi:MAG: DinB family protein [Chloroflexi bacterium]|nr:DinB family protein [Chloroflexota bacterium]